MASLVPTTAKGLLFYTGASTFRNHDDDGDSKAAGVYSHAELESSATESDEWASWMMYTQTLISAALAISVHNNTGGTLAAGTLVYPSSYSAAQSRLIVAKADADTPSLHALWIVTADILNSANGVVAAIGDVGSLNTAAGAVGDPVYLSGTLGTWTLTAPTGADQVQQVIGRIITSHASTGSIRFFPGFRLIQKVGTSFLQDDSITAAKIVANAVSNAEMATMAQSTIKGREAAAGTGDPVDLTATQATAILNNLVGDSGSGGTKGLAPAPGAGDAAGAKYLKADGTWATVSVPDASITPTKLTSDAILHVADGRLTVTSQTPIADSASASTIYYAPYTGNRIALYSGSTADSGRWELLNIGSEISITPGATLTSGRNYDVYVYNNGGTATLELKIWDSGADTQSRVTNTHNRQNGVLVLNSDYKRRYVGTVRTISTSAVQDDATKRFVWNAYNRVPRKMKATTTADYNYTTATFRQVNADTAMQLDFVIGITGDIVRATAVHQSYNGTANVRRSTGVGLDSTSVNSADLFITDNQADANYQTTSLAFYSAAVAIGRHYLAWLEYSVATGTTGWEGDAGVYLQSGIMGEIFA